MADTVLNVIEGMVKYIKFTVTDSSGVAVDCSSTTCTLTGGNAANASVYSVADNAFDKAAATEGILRAKLTFSTPGIFDFLVKIMFTATSITDEERFTVVIEDT